jgi:hypothetical protein
MGVNLGLIHQGSFLAEVISRKAWLPEMRLM